MRRWHTLVFVFVSLLAAACGSGTSNPLSTQGGRKIPYDKLRATPPEAGPPDYYFDSTYQDVMEFEQGVLGAFDLAAAAHVPAPGTPVMTIGDLPPDATFDGQTLSWRPPCGKDPEFYQRGYGLKYMLVTLKSNLDPDQFVQRRAVLLVHEFREYPDFKCEDLST